MVAASEGKDARMPVTAEEVDWSELQSMVARPDFIKRVLALNPLGLSQRPELLQQIIDRWPSLKVLFILWLACAHGLFRHCPLKHDRP
jgi:hypothetical protein